MWCFPRMRACSTFSYNFCEGISCGYLPPEKNALASNPRTLPFLVFCHLHILLLCMATVTAFKDTNQTVLRFVKGLPPPPLPP